MEQKDSKIKEKELSNHHHRSPSISVAEIIFTATDCFIWRKHHHRNHNHWWMITQSELRTQNSVITFYWETVDHISGGQSSL
ncbi:hypothetical protein P8452_02924 [Trifolium repens]|nr:hypothetical protein P8452_02924 [Trifolium repens]